DRSVQAEQVSDVQRAPRWAARRARLGSVSRRGIRHRSGCDERGAAARVPGHDERNAVRWGESEIGARILRRDDGTGRRGHDALARVFLRQGAGSETLFRTGADAADVPGDPGEPEEKLEVQFVAAISGISDGQADVSMHAVGHAHLQRIWMAETLLPFAGWIRGHVRGAAGYDRVEQLRDG